MADSVASLGESGDQDGYLGASVASLGVNTRLVTLQTPEKRVSLSFVVPDHLHHNALGPKNDDSAGLNPFPDPNPAGYVRVAPRMRSNGECTHVSLDIS